MGEFDQTWMAKLLKRAWDSSYIYIAKSSHSPFKILFIYKTSPAQDVFYTNITQSERINNETSLVRLSLNNNYKRRWSRKCYQNSMPRKMKKISYISVTTAQKNRKMLNYHISMEKLDSLNERKIYVIKFQNQMNICNLIRTNSMMLKKKLNKLKLIYTAAILLKFQVHH